MKIDKSNTKALFFKTILFLVVITLITFISSTLKFYFFAWEHLFLALLIIFIWYISALSLKSKLKVNRLIVLLVFLWVFSQVYLSEFSLYKQNWITEAPIYIKNDSCEGGVSDCYDQINDGKSDIIFEKLWVNLSILSVFFLSFYIATSLYRKKLEIKNSFKVSIALNVAWLIISLGLFIYINLI